MNVCSLAAALAALCLGACSGRQSDAGVAAAARRGGAAAAAEADAAASAAASIATAPAPVVAPVVAPWQQQLLDLAFGAAAQLPLDPHQKNRSRIEERIVAAALQLGDLERAKAMIPQIPGWQRGTAWADLAAELARRGGDGDELQRCLQRAEAVADAVTDDANAQDWPRDRIRARIARALLLRGQPGRAAGKAQGLPDFELATVGLARAETIDAAGFAAEMATLEPLLQDGSFDQQRAALATCGALLDRFYQDLDRRGLLLQRLRGAGDKLPLDVRIRTLLDAAATAQRHGDVATGSQLVDAAAALYDAGSWRPEHQLPLLAELATARHRLGDAAAARTLADAALATFHAQRPRIIDMYRAGALLPLAVAYDRLGDRDAALEVFRLALDESVVNPNSRPRVDDLAAICCSLATAGIRPDAALDHRMHEVADGLGAPW